jgi:F-type H+-transporting ATPase subunit a
MDNKNAGNKLLTAILFLVFLVGPMQFALGNSLSGQEQAGKKTDKVRTEGREVGNLIIEHITDSYEWHLFSVGEHHVTVPLPIILYDQGHWITFWSSEFHHNDGVYKGYFIAEKGMNATKIVRKNAAGKIVRPTLDLSITKMTASVMINALLVILIFLAVAKSYRKRKGKAPKGLQSAVEPLILMVRDEMALASIGEEHYEKFTPFLLSLFFFIFFSNLIGIVPFFPWGFSVTGNLAVTGVMAAFTFAITTYQGNKHYWKDIFNTPGVPWWLKFPIPLMPIVEILGIFTKPIVLMIRLFANMIAGHIVILGFIGLIFIFGTMSMALGYGVSLVSVGFSIFLDLLEVLIAFIQAYVFVILSALYFGLALAEPEH